MWDEPEVGCDAAGRRMGDYLAGGPCAGEARGMERHLSACRTCRARAAFERRLLQRLRELSEVEVSPEFEQRVMCIIASAEARGARKAAGARPRLRTGRARPQSGKPWP
jgi:hypothetical protein